MATIATRALDLTVAVAVLLLATPLLVLIVLAIRLDSRGSAMFRQERLGRRRRPFHVLKFRTMVRDADCAKHRDYVEQLIRGDERGHSDGRRELYKLAVDDRVTRAGRFLRKWSLDELPQLWNVVRGEMSLVGPRPVLAYEADRYPPEWVPRFTVKPGLTGLWQVSGRNERTYAEMAQLDVEYARRRSIGLDLKILFRTVGVVLRRRGAA